MIDKLNPYDYVENRPPNVVLVGCGGTGGFIARDIARLAKQHNFTLTLIDGDKVEMKNLVRQNFIEEDIGKFKAAVLAERYSQAFGANISCINKYLTLDMCQSKIGRSNLIVSAVDNNATRKILDSYCPNLWLDVGNELVNGQAFLSVVDTCQLLSIHPELGEKDAHPDEESCAERTASGEQSYTVNLTAALVAINFISAIIVGKKLPYFEVCFSNHNSFSKKMFKDYSAERDTALVNYQKLKALKEK